MPSSPPRSIAPYATAYWNVMFPDKRTGSWIGWKILTTGWSIAQSLAELQQRAANELGPAAPDAHRVLMLWFPTMWTPACADCSWLGYHEPADTNHLSTPVLSVRFRQHPGSDIVTTKWRARR